MEQVNIMMRGVNEGMRKANQLMGAANEEIRWIN
jgi:hypothetical protein